MKKISLLVALAAIFTLFIAAGDSPQEKYIKKYAALAVSEMYRSGVPASITLAQGLLESRYGLSSLATEGNNHFGIKCHNNWTGKRMYHDDDARGECFRVYERVEDSFRDHSDFLRYRDRYKFLFDNDITDYESWAYGLKKAGYATDPSYPSKLINLIEKYKLGRFDKMKLEEALAYSGEEVRYSGNEVVSKEGSTSKSSEKKMSKRDLRRERRALRRAEREARKAGKKSVNQLPESPLKLEAPKKMTQKARETFNFSLSREMYSQNGIPFIYSMEGETLESIAEDNNLFVREILKFNDLKSSRELLPGTIVYLAPKKDQAAKGVDKYIIDKDGEDLWTVSQRFGIKLESLRKLNGLTSDYYPRKEDVLYLRKVKMRESEISYE